METVRIDRETAEEHVGIPKEISLLEAAEKVARGELKISPQQIRMLIEILPYIAPKLSAMAVTAMSANDFAAKLDRAIARSDRAKLIEGKAIREDG
jgi:hypothetical protein